MMKAMRYMQELDKLMGELAALQQGQRSIDAFLAESEENAGGLDEYEDSAREEDGDEGMARRIDEYEDAAMDDESDAQDVLLIGREMIPKGSGDEYLGGLKAQEQNLMRAAERLMAMGEKLASFPDKVEQEDDEQEQEDEEEYEEEELRED
eukprot:3604036-Rhodomonas_salina.1